MKCNHIVVYLIIPLALFSTLSLFDNVQAQTNSTANNNQTTTSQQQQQQQQNQNANLTAQALMKTNIVELKNILMNAKLAIVDGNIKQALHDVRNVETELLLLEPSPPTKFLNNLHKAIGTIAKSEIDKSLNALTNIEISILKAENLILKNTAANPETQKIQQTDTLEQADTLESNKIKNIAANSQPQNIQQFDTLESNTNLYDFMGIGDR
jgi:hypothetical protein